MDAPDLPSVATAAEPSKERALLTAEDVARLLSVPKSWVYEQSRLGRIPTVTLGRYRRYRRDAIERWLCDVEELGGFHTRGRQRT